MKTISEIFVNTFEKELLEEMELYGSLVTVKAGDLILDIGQTVRTMPIILSGTVKVSRTDEDGKELLLYYVNANESCAMTFTCCMQQQTSEVKAVAEEDVEMFTVPVTLMDKWMSTYPTWKSFVMRTMQNRFHELLKTIDQIAFQKLDERLINYLKEKTKTSGSSLINISHEQIANELATSREVISRLLKKLEIDKKLLLFRNQIRLMKDM